MVDLYRPGFMHDYDIEITQGEDWVIGFRCLPRTDQGALYLEDTSDFTAIMSIFAPDPSGEELLTIDAVGGEITLGFTPPVWEASTAYGLGQKVVPTTLNGFVYECVVAGTSHSAEPTWPTDLGSTEPDNTASWRCETDDSQVCNVYVAIPHTMTAAFVPWGRGVYTLTVRDSFNHSWFHIDGAAYLRPSSLGPVG